jgi:hypothetical protein
MCSTTNNTFHTFGDSFIRLFTELPQHITTTHDEGIQCYSPFHITAPEGSLIALTTYTNRQWHIVATAIGTGEEQTITVLENIPIGTIHLTITGENLIRWEEDIPLEPFNRPFVVIDNIALNGGELTQHYNQPIVADINVTNVGLQDCDGGTVSMTSDSQLLTISQGETSFDALASNASQFISDAFQFTLSDSIHDRTHIPFTLTTHFGDETYSQEYEIEVLSPNIKAEFIGINDSQGNNNGRLDPGEFARLTFLVTNNGHYRADHPHFVLANNEGNIRVITPQVTVDDLDIDAYTEVSFDVFVEYHAGLESYVHLQFQSTINGILIEQEITCQIGYVMESFESGVFDTEYWTNDPVNPWIIESSQHYDGNFCAKSSPIDHDQISQLTLNFYSTDEGEISFFRRVSSEANYDFLVFYIDEVEQDRWSGDYGWKGFSYPTTAGWHNYKWAYIKDYSVNGGSDAAWIDYITLPPYLDETNEQTELPLTLHPNPTTDQVMVELDQEGDFNILVFDSEGKLILSEHNTQVISFKGLSSGIYHIMVEQNGQRWSRKIIKI